MNASIRVKIGVGFGIALMALFIIAVTLLEQLKEVESDSGWVSHTLLVESELNQLSLGLSEAEGNVRGNLLTKNVDSRQKAEAAMSNATGHFQTARTLTEDNTVQQKNFSRLESLIETRFAQLRDLLKSSEGTLPPTGTVDAVNAGFETDKEIKDVINDMMAEEQSLLGQRQDAAKISANQTHDTIVYGSLMSFLLVGIVAWGVSKSIIEPLRLMGEAAFKIGQGDYAHRVQVASTDETGKLAHLLNKMAGQVQERQRLLSEQEWLKSGLSRFTILFQGQSSLNALCRIVLKELAGYLETPCLVFYTQDPQKLDELVYQSGYAVDQPTLRIKSGEGLVGQCFALGQRLIIDEVPDDYIKVSSGLGAAKPKQLILQPVIYDGRVNSVIEMAFFKPLVPIQLTFLSQFSDTMGVVLNTIRATERTVELLEQSQKLSADLEIGQKQLRQKNDELEFQTSLLRASEVQLQEQQEELRQTNEELEQANEEMQQTNEEMEEKVNLLAEQKKEMERFNEEIEEAREALEEKAQELSKASKYKSDFLANMSHELRTPLNSLLILSKMLADNPQGNLTQKQVQFSETIHSSGNDLLQLLNDILDLSKIESGSVEMDYEEVTFQEVRDFVEQTFRPIADTKGITFTITADATLPERFRTDFRKLTQILKNLLSNSFKFTKSGQVELIIAPTKVGWKIPHSILDSSPVIGFSVRDTGTGIPVEKQQLIFEAFQQADAGINRQYGGTGLGLSISRELANLLGGSLGLISTPGLGSTFTLYLPIIGTVRVEGAQPKEFARPQIVPDSRLLEVEKSGLADDRENLIAGDRVLLIIDDDKNFAQIMVDFARDKQFKAVVARTVAQGVAIAKSIIPTAITLDLHLPDDQGWVVLDQLKHDPKTRHIPVHVISVDQERDRQQVGVVSYFQKPVTTEQLQEMINRTLAVINRPIKNLLIVEDDTVQRESLSQLLGDSDVKINAVGSSANAFAELEKTTFDCMVVDLGLPDSPGIDFLKAVHAKYGESTPPIIVYTGRELSREEETELRRIAESIIIKNIRSPERLLDETALFLHRVQSRLPDAERRMSEQVQKTSSLLEGRKILVVDDDVRNIFAIAAALESVQMTVKFAESGQAGIDLLQNEPDIEIVLMDVMMPGMDGFEAIRRIRQIERFRRLPIISVTAKAMRGDREKCLEAGASDYITKPVDMDKLKSLLRVWLYK